MKINLKIKNNEQKMDYLYNKNNYKINELKLLLSIKV